MRSAGLRSAGIRFAIVDHVFGESLEACHHIEGVIRGNDRGAAPQRRKSFLAGRGRRGMLRFNQGGEPVTTDHKVWEVMADLGGISDAEAELLKLASDHPVVAVVSVAAVHGGVRSSACVWKYGLPWTKVKP